MLEISMCYGRKVEQDERVEVLGVTILNRVFREASLRRGHLSKGMKEVSKSAVACTSGKEYYDRYDSQCRLEGWSTPGVF